MEVATGHRQSVTISTLHQWEGQTELIKLERKIRIVILQSKDICRILRCVQYRGISVPSGIQPRHMVCHILSFFVLAANTVDQPQLNWLQ
jgi:hypothetical protein